uniref:Putative protein-lysine deacylase ABHD14B n=1 Tax=Oryzias sinensis TaxID=183150 RepID=A0A8C7XZA2_9TELE
MSAVKMTEGSLLLESCSAPLFYRKSQPSSGDARMFVLLLHGIRFSSENWLSIGTLETLAKAGCCAVAIDLPELGRSKSAKAPAAVGELAPAGFLKEVCEKLNLVPVVVISPSLSGMYSLPFLLEYQALVRAYIPIAPICTEKFTAEQYQSVKVIFLPQRLLWAQLQLHCWLNAHTQTGNHMIACGCRRSCCTERTSNRSRRHQRTCPPVEIRGTSQDAEEENFRGKKKDQG